MRIYPTLACAALSLVCGFIWASEHKVVKPPSDHPHIIQSDYPVYRNLSAIVSDSDLIIKGTVLDHSTARRIIPEGIQLDQLPTRKRKNAGFLVTDAKVRIDEILSGDEDLVGSTIYIRELGGKLNGQEYVAMGQPLSANSEAYIYFLERHPDGTATVLGGEQGRYLIDASGVRIHPDSTTEKLPIIQTMTGMSLAKLRHSVALAREALNREERFPRN